MYILWKTIRIKKKKQLRLSSKDKINEIERLKEKVENNEDELLDH